MRTLTWKQKIWGKKFCDIWSPIAFLVFNVLETLRICKLMINLGIVKFLKKIIERKFVGVNQIRNKNGKESKW